MIIPASEWVREEIKNLKTHQDCVPLTSAIKPAKEEQAIRGAICNKSIGYFGNNANSVYDNANFVTLLSSSFSRGHGLPVISENFEKCCSLFAARKSVQRNWLNWQDEYMAPQ